MFTRNIKNNVQLTKSGVRWRLSAETPVYDPNKDNTLIDIKNRLQDIKNIPDIIVQARMLSSIRDSLKKVAKESAQQRTDINIELMAALADNSWFSPEAKTEIRKLQEEFTRDFQKVKEKKTEDNAPATAQVQAESNAFKAETVYNSPLLKWYAHRINLGSALELLKSQSGTNTKEKAEAALKAVKNSQIAYNSQSEDTPKTLSGYDFRTWLNLDPKTSNKWTNELLAVEADKLQDFYQNLAKATPAEQAKLLGAGIDTDKKVDSNNLADLIADFDDDGILEVVNGVDTSSWSKWFFSLVGSADAMQTQFFGEIQLRKVLEKSLPAIQEFLNIKGIIGIAWETKAAWAKRVRTAITVQADMLGTGVIGTGGAEKMYTGESGKRNLDERNKIEKILWEVQRSLEKNKNIQPADITRVARQVTDWIVRTQFTLGVWEINLNEISKIVSDPKDASLLAIDYSAMVRLFNSPRLKANARAWVWAWLVGGDLVPFAHIGADAKVTFADRADLEALVKNMDEWKSNITGTFGANLVTKMKGPAINVDLLWKDRIDQSENAVTHIGAVIDSILILDNSGNSSLDLTKIQDKKMDQSLRDILLLLSAAMVDGAKDLKTPNEKMAHAALLRNKFLNAFELYINNHPKMKGVGLAGMSFVATPWAFAFGPVFQNVGVRRDAKILKQEVTTASGTRNIDARNIDEELRKFGLTYDSMNWVFTLIDTSKKSLIVPPKDIDWSDNALTIGKSLDPIMSVDNGKLIITTVSRKTERVDRSPIAATRIDALRKETSLPKGIPELIAALPINTMIERPDVKRFMRAITGKWGIDMTISEAMKVPEIQKIIATQTEKWNESDDLKRRDMIVIVLSEIDEKLVGDQVTRMFNAAKKDPKVFANYKKLLAARWADVKGLTQENMTLGTIEKASYNKWTLRAQEAKIIANALNVPGISTEILGAHDTSLLGKAQSLKELKTDGSGFMLMARNRVGEWLQWARKYETWSYIGKEDLNLKTEPKIAAAKSILGDDLKKLAITNIANREEFAAYKNEILSADLSKLDVGKDGKMTLNLKDGWILTIDLSATIVSSALYGDTSMNNNWQWDAVCINVALLVEPKVSAIITGGNDNKTISTPSLTITVYSTQTVESVVFDGIPVASQGTVLGTTPIWKTEWSGWTNLDGGGGDGGKGDGGGNGSGGGGR